MCILRRSVVPHLEEELVVQCDINTKHLIKVTKFCYFLSQVPLLITQQWLLPIAVGSVNNGESLSL